jgi:succinyl-diaminopimelate desuccinylase
MPISKEILSKIVQRIDSYRDEMVEFQKELTPLVAMSTDNGGKGEWERARFLRKKIESFNINDITEYNAEDSRVKEGTRPNMVVRLKGAEERPTTWVMAHMDVVPPGEESSWDTPPFEAVEKDGKIYGRGVEDNQQGLVSALFAMKALAEEGIKPKTDIALLLVADEETGNKYGIDHVLESEPNLVDKNDIVIVPDSGNPDGTMVEVAEKTILWCQFKVIGKQVHASMPHAGINAHRAAAHLTARLDEILHKEFSLKDDVFDPPGSTFEPTKHDANVPNINTIPGEETFAFDCRILPNYKVSQVMEVIDSVVKKVEEEFSVKVEVTQPQLAEAAPATKVDAPVVKMVSEAVRDIRKVEPVPMGIGGGTVAALFRHRGIPAVVWSTMDDLAHQPNEYIVIDNMVEDAKVFGHIFCQGL